MPGEQPQELPQAPPRGGRWVTVLIVSVGLFALAGFSFLKFSSSPSMRLETCFQDVNGLRRGSKVLLAGVDIGVVREVRAQPTNKVPWRSQNGNQNCLRIEDTERQRGFG